LSEKGKTMALTTIQGISERLGIPTNQPHSVDRKLDNAVEDSFPASDPVQLSMPHDREELNLHHPTPMTTWMLVGGGLLAVIALIALRR
jgi:hypothetical protein